MRCSPHRECHGIPWSRACHDRKHRVIPATNRGLAGGPGKKGNGCVHGRVSPHGEDWPVRHVSRKGNLLMRKGIIVAFMAMVAGSLFVRSEERRVGKECRSRVSAYH